MNGFRLPWVEYGIAVSVLTLGTALVSARKLPVVVAMGFVGLFALFHGHAHGTEMPYLSEPACMRSDSPWQVPSCMCLGLLPAM